MILHLIFCQWPIILPEEVEAGRQLLVSQDATLAAQWRQLALLEMLRAEKGEHYEQIACCA